MIPRTGFRLVWPKAPTHTDPLSSCARGPGPYPTVVKYVHALQEDAMDALNPHDPRNLLSVIADQNQLLKMLMAEREALRDEVERLVDWISDGSDLDALTALQLIYSDRRASEAARIKAASAAISFERPKLSVTATTSASLFDLLEVRRRKAANGPKVIEHDPPPAA